eukprot:7144281-Lingulodinium_polyedra.AAC.1
MAVLKAQVDAREGGSSSSSSSSSSCSGPSSQSYSSGSDSGSDSSRDLYAHRTVRRVGVRGKTRVLAHGSGEFT